MKNFLLSAAVLFILVACEEQLTPPEVTEQFWSAVRSKDGKSLGRLVSSEVAAQPDLAADLPEITSWKIGKIVIDGTRSTVVTEITLADGKPETIKIDTLLVDEQDHWKIDYPATIKQFKKHEDIEIVLNRLDEISSEMLKGLDDSMEKFEDAVPVIEQEISRIEEQIMEKVPEIRERLDEFVRKLEEALKQRKSETQDKPVEI